MFSFDVSKIGLLSTIILMAICFVCTILVRQVSTIGWKRKAIRDLDLLQKLNDEAKTPEEIELVERYKKQIFKSITKGIQRPEKVHTKAEKIFNAIPGTIISTIEVLVLWGTSFIVSGNPFANLYLWVVVIFGIAVDIAISRLRMKERTGSIKGETKK